MNNNKFSKFGRISIIFVLLVTLFGFISINPSFANENGGDYCFCHNLNNNPQTLCFKNSSDDFGHSKHVDDRKDSFGKCGITPPPSVPEFGLVTGVMTFLSSSGVVYFIRKRV